MQTESMPLPSTPHGIKGFVPPDTTPKPLVVEPEWLDPAQPNVPMQFIAGLMRAWGLTIDDLQRALVNRGVDLLLNAVKQQKLEQTREISRALKRAAKEYRMGGS